MKESPGRVEIHELCLLIIMLFFYIPDKTKKLVTVIRVMYSGRDVDKQLDEFFKVIIINPMRRMRHLVSYVFFLIFLS